MRESSIKSRFALRLKQLREERDLSQASLAKELNISQSTIASWETCSREPSLQKIEETADAFGVSVDYLFGRADTPSSAIDSHTTFADVTPFEKTLLETYRSLSEIEQAMICRSLGLTHCKEHI